MSAPMKKHHTSDLIEVTIQDRSKTKFAIPRSASPRLIDFLQSLQALDKRDDLITADEVFKDIDEKYGKIGATIRGLRARDGLTQTELAKKLEIHQRHVSQIEHGKRTIGKKLAHKLAEIFQTNYRLFL